MKKVSFAASVLCSGLLLLGPAVCGAWADTMAEPGHGRSFTETVKDGYNSLKNSVSSAFGGYTGDDDADTKAYMDNYHKDLDNYHNSIREARDDYRRARLEEQKSYLEHHHTLPMQEDIDADITKTSW